jgi:hypothetical protein
MADTCAERNIPVLKQLSKSASAIFERAGRGLIRAREIEREGGKS